MHTGACWFTSWGKEAWLITSARSTLRGIARPCAVLRGIAATLLYGTFLFERENFCDIILTSQIRSIIMLYFLVDL